MTRSEVNVEIMFERAAEDRLDADELASEVSEALVRTLKTRAMRDLNPVVRVYDSGKTGEYPLTGTL